MNRKPIPPHVHGIFDYLGGVALLFAPEFFQFSEYGGPAVIIPRILGVVVLAQSLLTDYDVGVWRIIPMRVHLRNDYIAATLLALSPWIFGFSGLPERVWLVHVIVGIAVLGLTALTSSVPLTPQPKQGQTLSGVMR